MKNKIIKELINLGNEKDKKIVKSFFKINKGEYSYNDKFLGIKMSVLRECSKKYKDINLNDIEELLKNKYHEIRMFAILLLLLKYDKYPKEVYELYLENIDYINNWDLVDQSAHKIIGRYLYDNNLDKNIICELSNSNNMWYQRISIISTHYFIKNNEFNDSLILCKKFLNTNYDLIKKAVGWTLREIGKKDYDLLYNFLIDNIKNISTITFSYSTEHLDKDIRKYLKDLRKNNII